MKIAFLEAESCERKLFTRTLAGHELLFADSPGEVPPDTEVVSGFICSRIDPQFLADHPMLRLVATRSTTCDHIDLPACAQSGVRVCSVPSYGHYTVAEHAMALLLALARRLHETADARLRMRQFSYESIRGIDVRGKTLGIIGTGRIGLHMVQLARCFGMEIIAHDIHPDLEAAEALGFSYLPLDKLLRRSHIISLHATLNGANRHLLDRQTLAKCRPGVLIVNTARGGLIDTGALIDALDTHRVGGAALDVIEEECLLRAEPEQIIGSQIVEHMHAATDSKESNRPPRAKQNRVRELQLLMRNSALINRKRVIYTPHCSFNTTEAIEKINTTTLANIRAFAAGKPINLITLPADGSR